MLIPHVQIQWKHERAESVRPDDILRVAPEDDAPRGRKAALMAAYWWMAKQKGAAGVIWQDPDIVCDPDDLAAMRTAIEYRPTSVAVASHKLWPASTMRDSWVWAHGLHVGGYPVLGQVWQKRAEWFALGLTYTPGRLLDLAYPHMPAWVFGQVDNGLSNIARVHGIPGFAVKDARPKHLHFYPREDDASWRPGHISAPLKTR